MVPGSYVALKYINLFFYVSYIFQNVFRYYTFRGTTSILVDQGQIED